MGDKSQAKKAMIKAGVPVVPGSPGVVEDEDQARRVAKDVGFPVILKASAGGGGRGMRVVREMSELLPAFRAAQAEAAAAFGVPDVYIERYVDAPRHIEIQVMADSRGNVGPPGRARVLDPAAPPEDHRGGALADRGREAAPAHGPHRGGRRAGRCST